MCTVSKMSNPSVASQSRWTNAVRVGALLSTCFMLNGCGKWFSQSSPTITFTKVPAQDNGGPDVLKTVSGHVTGARSGQHVILYAKNQGRWWMQPAAQSTLGNAPALLDWAGQTHSGTEYGALLVDSGFTPAPNTEQLPAIGGPIAAVATVEASGSNTPPVPPKLLRFSGYDWKVRVTSSPRGGFRNQFDPANAWVDDKGFLHLKIARKGNGWTCSEVQLTRSLGYGTYVFVVRDISHMDLSAALTLFASDGRGSERNRRELSYEISHWGNPNDKDNTSFVIQPYYVPTNVFRFRSPAGKLTETFEWEPTQATYKSYAGLHAGGAGGHLLKQHVFTSSIPSATDMEARMNLYFFGKGQVPLQHENEIVIEKFEFLP
jgi:hypothetical protein